MQTDMKMSKIIWNTMKPSIFYGCCDVLLYYIDAILCDTIFWWIVQDWELRYLHENYSQALDPNTTLLQPCPDVYWFPVFTPAFTWSLIDEMENFGSWSNGQNSVSQRSTVPLNTACITLEDIFFASFKYNCFLFCYITIKSKKKGTKNESWWNQWNHIYFHKKEYRY